MWFRNLQIYRLTQDLQIDAAALEQALASKPARPCESQELTTYGFAAPFGKGPNAPLVHASRGRHLLDQINSLLGGFGYAVAETTHDCGELGGLAQSR
ncbi:TPA: recombination-associated protein RdgC, partial [Pseudomonas aeruginosa]